MCIGDCISLVASIVFFFNFYVLANFGKRGFKKENGSD